MTSIALVASKEELQRSIKNLKEDIYDMLIPITVMYFSFVVVVVVFGWL